MKTTSFAGIRCASIAAIYCFAAIFLAPLSFAQDLTPPTLAVTQPVNNSWVNNLSVVAGTATDDILVASVTISIKRENDAFFWNGSAWSPSETWLNAGVYPSSWTYSNVPAWVDGSSYTVVAKVMDTSGKWSVVYSTSAVIYDVTPPDSGVTTQMYLNHFFYPSQATQYIYGTASDALPGKLRGFNAVWISIRTKTPPYLCYSNIANDLFLCPSNPYPNDREWFQAGGITNTAANPAVWVWDASNIVWRTDVEYDLQVVAMDEAGNKRPYPGANASDMTFFVPQISISHPSTDGGVYKSRDLLTIEGDGANLQQSNRSGSGSAVSIKRLLEPAAWWDNAARIWVDHEAWTFNYTSIDRWTSLIWGEDVFAANYASYTITAIGYSGAERASAPAQRTVIVDNVAPVSRIVSPPAGESLASFSAVAGTASDVTDVAQVEVRIRRMSDGRYWTGAAWLTAETWNTAVGTSTWSLSGYLPAALTPGTSYTLTSRATDIAGNVENYDAIGSTFTFINIEPPGSVTSLAAAAGSTMGALTLFWRSPGNDGETGMLGPGSAYYIQYTTYSPVSWSTAAAQISISTADVNPGTSQYHTLTGLPANINYYFRLWTKDDGGNYSALSNGATAATLIESPVSVYFDEISTTSIVASAYAPTPAFTGLETGLSGVNISINGVYSQPWRRDVASAFTDLTPNTQYSFNAKARNQDGVETGETIAFSTYTLAVVAKPTGPVFTNIFLSSITVNWSSGTSAGGFNGPGASYNVQISTAVDFSAVFISSVTDNLQLPIAGLLAEATYYFRVRAANSGGVWGYYLTLGPASIVALDAVSPAVGIADPPNDMYTSSSLKVSGTAADNVSVSAVLLRLKNLSANEYWNGTSWVASDETWLNATVLPSSWTYSGAPVWVEGSSYTVAAKAMDISGNWSSIYYMNAFIILPIHLSTPDFTAADVGSSSITWSWMPVARAAGYRVLGSTGGNISAELAQASVSWAETGLLPNTPYTRQLMALNAVGISTSPVFTRYTLAVPPSGVSGAVLATSSISVSWDRNLNPQGTDFELSYSSVGYFQDASADSQIYRTKAVSFVLGGLLPYTTYYFSVRALNSVGIASEFSSAAPVRTFPLSPSTPLLSNGAVGVSSIVWTWAGVPYGENYRVSGSNGVNLSGDLPQDRSSWTETGLLANTQYVRRVIASNSSGASGSDAVARYTLAFPPANFSAAAIYLTSASLNWGLNNNPAGTIAELSRSLDGIAYATLMSTSSMSFQDAALDGCATYYYRIRNLNGDAVPTSYAGPIQVFMRGLGPMPANGLAATSMPGRRISLNWLPSPGPGLAYYRLYFDGGSGIVDYSAPVAVLSSTSTSYITGVLISSPSYNFALRAVNQCGTEESNVRVLASAPALDNLAGVRAAIKEPRSGKKVSGNRLTVMAEVIQGEPFQVAEVRFQYKASASANWLDMIPANNNPPNPDNRAPYFVQWDVTALASGNYDLRAVASDNFYHTDEAAPAVTVMVDNNDYDLREAVQGDGKTKKEQVINNSITSVMQVASTEQPWMTKISIPASAVSIPTVTLSMINNPSGAPVPTALLNSIGQVTEITLSNLQHQLSNGQTAEIELTYPDVDGDGLVDGTTHRAESLKIFSYDPLAMSWKDDLTNSVDKEHHKIIGRTRHFSYFAVFAPVAANLNAACLMYPNPWKPGSGGMFDAGGVTFANLDTGGTIRIFTIAGELVRELSVSAADARVKVWDGKNNSGSKAASGVYLVRASFNGTVKILKLAVER